MTEAQERILENYKNPKNFGIPAWRPTHSATIENLSCGDSVTMLLLVEGETVKDACFNAEGCSIAIGSTSLLLKKIIGMKLNETKKILEEEYLNYIGIELKETRKKCALLGFQALKKAIDVE
ncbi:MAG: SUF system NifU family Fe-S cluster assembly protein [Candidatus Dojkabacteria bacterium]